MEELQQQITDLEELILNLREQIARQSKVIGYIAERNSQIVRDAYQFLKLPE